MSADLSPSEQSEPTPPTIEIVGGKATDEELAALIAVVTDAYAHEAAEAVVGESHVSVWGRTQRAMRSPLRTDLPWGRYAG